MNFSWPHRAAEKTARRSAARVGLAGFAVVAAAGGAALAAPAMSAMAATGTNETTTAFSNLGEINTMPFGTFTYTVDITVTDDVADGPAPTGTVDVTAPADIQLNGGNPVDFTGCSGGTAVTLTPAAGLNAAGLAYSTGTCAVSTPTNSYGFVLMEGDYSGDANNAISSVGDTAMGEPEVKMINLMPTTTTVGPNTAAPGTVDLVAHVLPDVPGEPADTNILNANSETLPDLVNFTVNGAAACTGVKLGPPATDPTTNNGPNFADCDMTLAAGTYTVVATFSGDEYANTSTVTQTITVKAGPTATTTTMSGTSGYVGIGTKLTAKVKGASPTGTVKFVWGSKTLCTGSVSNGVAHCTHAFSGLGTFKVDAVYEGNATNKASTSAAVTVKVTKQPTSVKVTASKAIKGKTVTLTAAVLSLSSATGTVTFSVNGHAICTAKVVNGRASCKHTWKTAGTYKVTAAYSGNATHAASKGTDSVKVAS